MYDNYMWMDRIYYWTQPYINLLLNYFKSEKYGIKQEYVANYLPRAYIDSEEMAAKYQAEVYKKAARLIKKYKLKNVVDVGCGHGVKLERFIKPVSRNITGIDTPISIGFCKDKYKFGKWVADDISKPYAKLSTKHDLVMSVDVIEHLINPDDLVNYIKGLSKPGGWVLISTPERDRLRGKTHNGPAGEANPAHVREWNQKELKGYLTSRGMTVMEQILVNDVSGKHKSVPGRNFGNTCQVVIGKF